VGPDAWPEQKWRDPMSVAIYVVLTVAMFAILGLVQKAVEKL
jgi:hypothetical protein